MTNNHDPHQQISSENPWYTDDQFSIQYDRPGSRAVIENRWKIFEQNIKEFLSTDETISPDIPLRILDAGCGDGINLLGLSNMVHAQGWNAQLFGVDYNPLRLERASKLPSVKEVHQSPLNTLPYVDGSFDAVLCNQVLEHIPQDKEVLQELKRVIRPGGMLILGVPNEGCTLAWLRNHVMQRSILQTTDHVNFYTEKTVSKLLTDSGFCILNINKAGFFLPHLALHYVVSFTETGRKLLNGLGKIWKSQSAELILISIKE